MEAVGLGSRTLHARVQHCRHSSFFYFPANGSTNPDAFQPETFSIPQNFSSSGLVVSEEFGNKHANKQTHKLTEILLLL